MQAAMPPQRETDNLTNSTNAETPSQAVRENVTQALLRASKRDCNNSRDRFIPRSSLAHIINADLVGRLLRTIPGKCTEDANHRQHVAQLICPETGECSCRGRHCLGRRMIFATLLLCGREDLIQAFLPPATLQTCDNNLPLRFNSPEAPDYGLNPDERELFFHFQWQVYTPFVAGITSATGESEMCFPEEASLPWMETTRMGEQVLGEVSYVERIEIDPLSHSLDDETKVFALKTFEQKLTPGLSAQRFRREVTANIEVRKHDRIVPLLTAFTYRERFYLVFPLATEGSLEKLWRAYIPAGIVQDPAPARIADWYSDEWLIGECLGIAEALLATHGSVGCSPETADGLLHADIKPENILCFLKSDQDKESIVLKLADFGEATRATSNLPANAVAHVMTYRPPEHSPGNIITLNYDVWSLGCLFLDFVIWATFGQDGLETFAQDREDEPDEAAVTENPAQMIEDTFFKRVKQEPTPFLLTRLRLRTKRETKVGSGRATTTRSLCLTSHVDITSRLKDAVILRLALPEQNARCSDRLKQLIVFIRDRMLVVNPRRRADSREVRDYLQRLFEL